MTQVNLFYEYSQRGPGKVAANLIKGLQEIQINCVSNNFISEGYCGLLQSISGVHDKKLHSALCGPNLFVLPVEWGNACKQYSHFIVPSQWVSNLYRKFTVLDHATIDVWPVGIDTKFWEKNIAITAPKCLVYFKHRSDEELSRIVNKLNKLGIGYEILKYGYYTENDLVQSCNRCNFCIILTGTESQGIGYMEILSMGLPCYVMNKNSWDDGSYKVEASSVPYFDGTCGIITDTFDLDKFDEFVQSLDTYKPRDFICGNFTLSKKATDYYQLLKKYNCLRGN